jgi:signal transduction histidine kinase
LGTSLALSRAVRPVHDLATETSKLPPDDLRPVAVPDGPQEVVALATELNALLSRVRSEAARRNRFLATLSHEMRTPLTVARGQLELLALYGPRDPADAEQTAAVAAAEVVRAASMLDAFLNLARSQEPGFVAPTPQYLPVLAADLRMRLSAMPEVTVAEPPAITVPVDPERIAQAVLNCVTNALRAADTVIVAMEHGSQWLTISVDDNGPGWPADKHALLRPFTSASGSSGLGLAVVQAIAEAHGGNVELVDSALGGARVEIQVAAQ